jgi:hypothetical protein
MFGQWAPLICAAILAPSLGWVAVVKPTVGLAPLIASGKTRDQLRAIAVGVGLVIVSLVLMPTWPQRWWQSLHGGPQFSLLGHPLGWVLLLAALRWRRPEARMLLTLAIVPHTISLCETVYLLLIPQGLRSLLVFCGLSFVTFAVQRQTHTNLPEPAATTAMVQAMRVPIILLLYLPALVLVLRRPNVGAVPSWVDRLLRKRPDRRPGSDAFAEPTTAHPEQHPPGTLAVPTPSDR